MAAVNIMNDSGKKRNNKAIIRKIVDALMCILLMLLMAYQVTGEALHEWIGMGMTLTWIVHHVLNRKWYGALTKGRYSAYRIVSTIVNSLLLIAIILTAVCGMSMSGHAVPFMYGLIQVSTVRPIHLAMSHWSFVLMGIHFGLHVPAMTAGMKLTSNARRLITGLMMVAAGYGLYLFLNNNMTDYLFFRSVFAMLDYDKAGILVILENVIMMLFWVFAGVQVFNICKALSTKKKE